MMVDASTNSLSDITFGALSETQQEQIATPADLWTDDFALKVAVYDFERAANYRSMNHDWRWNNADNLYLGYVPQKFWEGTKIPRANISMFTAYEQIEEMVPRIMQALFAEDVWFEADALGAMTSPQAARASRDVILAQMENCGKVPKTKAIRQIVEIAVRDALIYGNGILELSWLYDIIHEKKFIPQFVPQRQAIQHPLLGTVWFPTGGFDRIIKEIMVEQYDNRPIVEHISIKDFYIDPNCPSHDPNDARYTIRRSYTHIDYLKSLRGVENFYIPEDDELVFLGQNKPSAQADNTKSYEESARQGSWQPQVEQSLDPGASRVELLRYKTDRRICWIVNRERCIYNVPNPYGRKLQYNLCYTDLVDRFYGLAVTDVTEGEQRLQEGIVNSRVDELALNIHAATIVKRGNTDPVYKLRVRPGAVQYSDDPKNDHIRQYTNNITQQAFAETAASDIRVQKITGLNDLVSGGQNPVARSATGAGLQGQATFARSQYQVEKVETNILEPMLTDIHMLNNHHLDPNQMIAAGKGQQIDPIAIFGAEVEFRMRAGSRMASKQTLAMNLQWIMQYMTSPQLEAQLNKSGRTIDYEEVFQLLIDATGYAKKATWIRPLTQQEQQAMQDAMTHPMTVDLVKQRERMAQMADMQQNKDERAMAKDVLNRQSDFALEDKKQHGENQRALLTAITQRQKPSGE
jgi:hypothetical protein